MKVLYAHGMTSRPIEWKLEQIRTHGFDVYALHLPYPKHPNSFEILVDYCKKHQIEALIGHSHGGYFSYWLAEELGIPCLLINPHFSLKHGKRMQPPITHRACPLCLVVLGTDDQLVDPDRSATYLKQETSTLKKNVKIKWLTGVGHSIGYHFFGDMVKWLADEVMLSSTHIVNADKK